MSRRRTDSCVDPQVGRLLGDEISGALTAPGREEDHRLFGEHIKRCGKCREAVLDHANQTVTMPILERIAREKGVPLEDVLDAFAKEVRAMGQAGKLKPESRKGN